MQEAKRIFYFFFSFQSTSPHRFRRVSPAVAGWLALFMSYDRHPKNEWVCSRGGRARCERARHHSGWTRRRPQQQQPRPRGGPRRQVADRVPGDDAAVPRRPPSEPRRRPKGTGGRKKTRLVSGMEAARAEAEAKKPFEVKPPVLPRGSAMLTRMAETEARRRAGRRRGLGGGQGARRAWSSETFGLVSCPRVWTDGGRRGRKQRTATAAAGVGAAELRLGQAKGAAQKGGGGASLAA